MKTLKEFIPEWVVDLPMDQLIQAIQNNPDLRINREELGEPINANANANAKAPIKLPEIKFSAAMASWSEVVGDYMASSGKWPADWREKQTPI